MNPASPAARKSRAELPLIYSCSGCSSAAQMANQLALELDRAGVGEMSCIAGVGGDVPSLVRIARSKRPIVALDGCHLHCAKSCLARHGIEPTLHHTLSSYGVKKRVHEDFDRAQARAIFGLLEQQVARLTPEHPAREEVATTHTPQNVRRETS